MPIITKVGGANAVYINTAGQLVAEQGYEAGPVDVTTTRWLTLADVLALVGWLNVPTEVTDDYTVLLTDGVVLVSGTVTVTLPPVFSCAGHFPFIVKNVGTGVVTVVPDAVTEPIDDEVAQVLYENDSVTLKPGALEWSVV